MLEVMAELLGRRNCDACPHGFRLIVDTKSTLSVPFDSRNEAIYWLWFPVTHSRSRFCDHLLASPESAGSNVIVDQRCGRHSFKQSDSNTSSQGTRGSAGTSWYH